MRRALNYLFLTRPVVLIPVWGFCILGFIRAFALAHHTALIAVPLQMQFPALRWILIFSGAPAAVYVINQIADRLVDQANPGFPLLVKCKIGAGESFAVAGLCAAIALAMPLVYHRPAIAFLSAIALALGVAYCLRPFYFSGRPCADFLANACGYGIVAFGAGWSLGGLPLGSILFVKACAPYFLLMCAGSISSTIPDIGGDKACGKITTAVRFGARRAHLIALFCIVGALASALIAGDRLALLGACLAMPLYLAYAVRPNQLLMEATYKAGGAIIMLLAALFFPLFFVLGILVFLAAWLYFRYMHGVNYPSLLPATRNEKR
ncbi:MAG: UbiA family prenyltransferase [Chitinivibrionales bacterium]|nr:UbiA family prenyltransferase [Chitinivibrionales bacterium]